MNWGLLLSSAAKAAGPVRQQRAAEARQAKLDQIALDDRKRQQEKEALTLEVAMRNSGYIPDAEANNDAGLSGRSLDELVGAATGSPVVGMKDTGSRYGQSVGGYRYDRMNPKAQAATLEQRVLEARAREADAQAKKYEHDAMQPTRSSTAQRHYDSERGVIVDEGTGEVITPKGLPPKPTKPKEITPKQPNESNTKAAGMLHRLIPVGQDLNKFDDRKTLDAIAAKGGLLGNWVSSPEGRQLTAAGKAWIFSVLRPESGATIGDKEQETYNSTYLPQPGDDDQTLAMKRKNRRLAEEGVAIQAGPAFTGGPRSAMEADSLANPTGFTKKYYGGPNVDEDRAAAILKKHGVQ